MSNEIQPHISDENPKKRPSNRLVISAVFCFFGNFQSLDSLYTIWINSDKSGTLAWKLAAAFTLFMSALSFASNVLIVRGLSEIVSWSGRPDGKIFDFLIPPEDAEYRALALEIAFDRWCELHSRRRAWILYCIHVVSSVVFYYVDRIKRGK